jgi:tetratricopeptide (TPR) repeat protein
MIVTLGSSFQMMNLMPQSIACYECAVCLNPENGHAWYNLATIHHNASDWKRAEECYRTSIDYASTVARDNVNADYTVRAMLGMGSLLCFQERHGEAVWYYQQALTLEPDSYTTKHLLLNCYAAIHDNQGFTTLVQRLLHENPNQSHLFVQMANKFRESGHGAKAIVAYRGGCNIEPGNFSALINLGNALSEKQQLKEALQVYTQAQAVDVKSEWPPAGMAHVYMKRGQFQKAFDQISPLVANTDNYDVACVYAQLASHLGHYESALVLIERLLKSDVTHVDRNRQLHFSGGFVCDKLKRYKEAFAHYQAANKLRPVFYSQSGHEAYINAIMSAFTKEIVKDPRLQALRTDANLSEVPVFIMGMPRSGSTLVEQVLGCHPSIATAGELMDARMLCHVNSDFPLRNFPNSMPAFLSQDPKVLAGILADIAVQHLSILRNVSPAAQTAARITNKMPWNFMYLGLLAMIFPNAKFIHAHRNPLDTGLSIYMQNFSGGLSFSFDLDNIAHYRNQCLRVLHYWTTTVQLNVLHVAYEDLVDSQEAVSRKIIDFVGLPWDAKCLSPHKLKRTVHTASLHQVVKPIYTSSKERWRNYKEYLQPLMDRVTEYDAAHEHEQMF